MNLLSRGPKIRVDTAPQDRTPIEIHSSKISLYHGLNIHGSGPNSANDRRIACVIRYITTEVVQEVSDKDYAMLARGPRPKRSGGTCQW